MALRYTVSDCRVMALRCVRRSWRDPEAFFTALMLPILLMLLFVYVFGGDLNTGGKYVNYVVPGLIVLCAGFGAGTTAVAVATDMANGIVDRFRLLAVPGSSVLIGQVAASLARNLLATVASSRRRDRDRVAPDRLVRPLVGGRGDDRAVRAGALLARRERRPSCP